MNFKEHACLDRTILISFPDDWVVKEKDNNVLKNGESNEDSFYNFWKKIYT